jgi:probable HAF family extracellular repeat protein
MRHHLRILPLSLLVLAACADVTAPPASPEAEATLNRGQSAVLQTTYELTDLGTLGGNAAFALGINNRGDIVGTSRTTTASRPQIAFLTSDGVMQNLGTLEGSTFSRAFRVNNQGVAVGEAFTATGASRAVLWRDGQLVELAPGMSAVANDVNSRSEVVGTSGGSAVLWHSDGSMVRLGAISAAAAATSRGNAIAENGRVAGSAQTDILSSFGSRVTHAFLWNGREMLDLGALVDATNFSQAFGVNARSEVVGESVVGGGTYHAFLWRNGRMEDIHPEALGIRHSRANDINASGQVVGWVSTFYAFPTFGSAAAVVWSGGVASNLNDLVANGDGWDLRAAMRINDRGQIVGYGLLNGETRAFLLTPTRAGASALP